MRACFTCPITVVSFFARFIGDWTMPFILIASAEIGKLSVFPGEGATFFHNFYIFYGYENAPRKYNDAFDARSD